MHFLSLYHKFLRKEREKRAFFEKMYSSTLDFYRKLWYNFTPAHFLQDHEQHFKFYSLTLKGG